MITLFFSIVIVSTQNKICCLFNLTVSPIYLIKLSQYYPQICPLIIITCYVIARLKLMLIHYPLNMCSHVSYLSIDNSENYIHWLLRSALSAQLLYTACQNRCFIVACKNLARLTPINGQRGYHLTNHF